MSRHIQFGARKNPAPHSRQHGLNLAADTNSENAPGNDISPTPERRATDVPANELQPPLYAAPLHAATVGEVLNQNHLLTVHEVADLLQVPMSWVYGRTRKRSTERLPGYRLGKYWRFHKHEVLTWVQNQKSNFRAA
ncbi:MAG: helix-turn-helix domain-containing protein [Candidatus Dormibacteria bacterium]